MLVWQTGDRAMIAMRTKSLSNKRFCVSKKKKAADRLSDGTMDGG